jgi:Rrf2 family protein
MLNQTSRYVLSVMCSLARHGSERVPAHQIARETDTPANYVAKILGVLRRQGVVDAEKGWGGGFTLRSPSQPLALGELLGFFGERVEVDACPFVEPQCGCPLARSHPDLSVAGWSAAGSGVPGPDGVICPFGASECLAAAPCPLHAHWAKVREGLHALASTPVAELIGSGLQ